VNTIRVLYAEDNRADRDLTQRHFEMHAPEIQLETVPTGEACLDRLGRTAFDLLLLDNHLPDMEGTDVLASLAKANLQLPVVVVTAAGDEDLVVRLIQLGASDYVAKQGDYLDELPAIVRATWTEYQRTSHRNRAARRQQRRVLYIERNPADIDLTCAVLAEQAPYLTVQVARSSHDALAKMSAGNVDLVLTDLRMQDLTAIELLREMRHRGLSIPVVVVTGRGHESNAVAALKLGAYDYVVKREGYLTQLPHVLENAINRFEIEHLNRRLETELEERRRAEAEGAQLAERLQQAQKLDALGRLAGGVAHDFNNLLTVIMGEIDLVLADLPEDVPARANLADAQRCAQRAASLTRQLLAFSRRQILQPQILDLNTLVAESATMLRRLLGEDVVLVTLLGEGLGRVKADPIQIDQVIMNLSVNARDAMPTGGRLSIQTQNVTVRSDDAERHAPVPPGAYVTLEVRDTGHAIDAATLPRIFDPFFTTKEQGRGTGLGLATVYGIVKQSNGWIRVDSVLGQGSAFTVYLPRVDAIATAVEPSPADGPLPAGCETILLVEDEESVRGLSAQVLRRCGYHVLEAANGADALLVSEKW
jgi:signal transduction histidine kinase